jgi:hypothetical protein
VIQPAASSRNLIALLSLSLSNLILLEGFACGG